VTGPRWMRCVVAGTAALGRPGTHRRVCGGHSRCRETATCVRDPAHCEPPDGRRSSSSVPGCEPSSGAVHGSPAGRNRESKKNFCCVTTRRRKLWDFRYLGRGLGALTACVLSLCMLGFDSGVPAPFGLPLRCLPAAELLRAFLVLAVTLVPTPRLVLASTAFAQADPRARASRTGTAGALWFNVAGVHGSNLSQGLAREERTTVLPGRLSKRGTRPTFVSLPSAE